MSNIYAPNNAVRMSVARTSYEEALMRQQEIERMRRALRPPVVLLMGVRSCECVAWPECLSSRRWTR